MADFGIPHKRFKTCPNAMQCNQCNAMQRNAIMQFNAMQAMQSIVNKEHGVVVANACDGAYYVAFYACEMHDLHACI